MKDERRRSNKNVEAIKTQTAQPNSVYNCMRAMSKLHLAYSIHLDSNRVYKNNNAMRHKTCGAHGSQCATQPMNPSVIIIINA